MSEAQLLVFLEVLDRHFPEATSGRRAACAAELAEADRG